jgi:hypothetical protein
MLVRHRLLRFLRLLVTLATVFSAQPSVAARAVVDPIVLVSHTTMAEARSDAPDDDHADDERVVATPRASAVGGAPRVSVLAALQSTHALLEHIYLHHCALLR